MRYSLDDPKQVEQAREYLNQLIRLGTIAEVKRVNQHRSLPQNAYLHLLITAYAMHFGWNMEEAKSEYKRINASTYLYEKNGKKFVRSSADLDKDEMAKTIDKFMRVSAENGCPLPLAENADWLNQIANEAESSGFFL